MKKKYLILLLIILPFLTACGNKTLNCEINRGTGIVRNVNITYSGDKVSKVTIKDTVDFTVAGYEEHGCKDLQECIDSADNELKKCQEDDGYESCKITKTETGYILEATQKESSYNQIKDLDKDVLKARMEETGATCK